MRHSACNAGVDTTQELTFRREEGANMGGEEPKPSWSFLIALACLAMAGLLILGFILCTRDAPRV